MITEPPNSIVPRRSPDGGNCGGEDRLSCLPDSIISHILSFLPTKFGAATSILSSRWRYILFSVPTIDLDDSLLLYHTDLDHHHHHHHQEEANDVKRERSFKNFIDLVNRVVNFEQASSVIEFRLKISRRIDGDVLISWITSMLRRNVHVLDIRLTSLMNAKPLPVQLFSCKTLVVLKLSGRFLLEVPDSMCLPNLKVLILEFLAVLWGDNTSWAFSSGLPLLEELQFDTVHFRGSGFVHISIPSLRKLVWHPLARYEVDEVAVVINSPNLEYLEYKTFLHPSSSICKLNYLVRADLNVGSITPQQNTTQQWAGWLSCFLGSICSIKSLGFLLGCLEVLLWRDCSLPEFPNLTCMELTSSRDYHWELLEILLHYAPNLELLVCDMAGCRYTGRDLIYGSQEKPLCLTQRLRKIKIQNFCGDKFELQLLRYLLQHGGKLEMVSICPSQIGLGIREKLLKFSRSSQNCEIVFLE